MIPSFVFILLFMGAYLARRIGGSAASERGFLSAVWRFGAGIALVRIPPVWFWVLVASKDSGWLQLVGYGLVMVAWPELYLVRGARNVPIRWAWTGCPGEARAGKDAANCGCNAAGHKTHGNERRYAGEAEGERFTSRGGELRRICRPCKMGRRASSCTEPFSLS